MSILDPNNDLDLSQRKWDQLLDYFVERSQAIYFCGSRINYLDDDIIKNVGYLCEVELINEEFERILIRVKPANVVLNRNLLRNVWNVYERPSLIFSEYKENEDVIKNVLSQRMYFPGLFQQVDGLCLFYQDMQPNVLWLQSNKNISTVSDIFIDRDEV